MSRASTGHGERARAGVRLVDTPSSSDGRPVDATDASRARQHEDVCKSTTQDPRSTKSATRSTKHAHAHEKSAAGVLPAFGPFPHEKLDAYRVALEMAALSKELAKEIPRGHRSIADHMERAAANTVLLLAEGANRRGPAQKRQRFVESRGECGEVAAAADLLLTLDIGSQIKAEGLKHLAGRVSPC